jgi:hypothetical protein
MSTIIVAAGRQTVLSLQKTVMYTLPKTIIKVSKNSNVTAGNETSYHGLRISYFKNDIRTLKINALFIFHQFSYWPYHVQKKINM